MSGAFGYLTAVTDESRAVFKRSLQNRHQGADVETDKAYPEGWNL